MKVHDCKKSKISAGISILFQFRMVAVRNAAFKRDMDPLLLFVLNIVYFVCLHPVVKFVLWQISYGKGGLFLHL